MEIFDIIEKVKSPAFVYCHESLIASMSSIQRTIDEVCTGNWIAYSYKTNPYLAPYLAEQGCAMQVTSVSHLAKVASFLNAEAMERSFYCTGSLTIDDAHLVVQSGIHIVVDSLSQLEIVNLAAGENKKKPRVLIRVDAGQSTLDSPFGTSGMLQGIDINLLGKLLNEPPKNVCIIGIHNHFGSQVVSLESWEKNIGNIASVLCNLDFPLELLNIGGGIPIPYDRVKAIDIADIYRKCLMPSLKIIMESHPDLRIVVEPGRILAGPCGYLVASVTNLHTSDTQQGANLDVSLFAAFQDRFLSSLEFQLPVLKPQASGHANAETILRGSSPASIDYFGVYHDLPDLRLGDKVIFGMAGAYASSMGSSFSGVERPAEYLLRGGTLEAICNDR